MPTQLFREILGNLIDDIDITYSMMEPEFTGAYGMTLAEQSSIRGVFHSPIAAMLHNCLALLAQTTKRETGPHRGTAIPLVFLMVEQKRLAAPLHLFGRFELGF